MKRGVLIVGLGVLWLSGMAIVAVGADEKPALPSSVAELEKMSGKELYRATCKQCHAPKSPAGEYAPLTLIQDQWTTFFDKKYAPSHAALLDSTKAVPEWATPEAARPLRLLTPSLLEKIRKFAIDGAADSEHPMTCG